MSGDEVRVDYDALDEIARQVRSEALSIRLTRLPIPDAAELGHSRLAGSIAQFAATWNTGVERTQDGTESLGDNIGSSIQAYQHADSQVATQASPDAAPQPK
jgi:uncharacterized protein YukE